MNIVKNYIYGIFLLCFFLFSVSDLSAQAKKRDIYELKVYHLSNQQQEEQLDSFLKDAYIPALHKAGVKKVGVYKPMEGDSLFGKRVYVLTPYQSAEQLIQTPKALEKDKKYLSVGKAYMNATHDNPPYERIETIVMQAFEGMPQFRETDLTNAPEKRIYELRSYESATESLFHNKVDMFNKGEVDIFKNIGANPVFFGEVVAGANMPNLMYMTAYEDMGSREAKWKAFGDDPEWKRMESMEKYQNNVSHIDVLLLNGASYSEL